MGRLGKGAVGSTKKKKKGKSGGLDGITDEFLEKERVEIAWPLVCR